MQPTEEKFFNTLSQYEIAISYIPLPSEINPDDITRSIIPIIYRVPTNIDPFDTARQVRHIAEDKTTCLYIPGIKFDTYGMRQGRGKGWYDKFLSSIPATWLRIGFCTSDQFSEKELERKPWDELIDWVCVKSPEKTSYYETRGRLTNL